MFLYRIHVVDGAQPLILVISYDEDEVRLRGMGCPRSTAEQHSGQKTGALHRVGYTSLDVNFAPRTAGWILTAPVATGFGGQCWIFIYSFNIDVSVGPWNLHPKLPCES